MSRNSGERQPIGKRLRFEVFKRDGFACVYCGAKPPEVVLHVDHVRPVAEGGTNEIDNLLTACAGCNSGKGATPLDGETRAMATQALAERMERRDAFIQALAEDWARRTGGWRPGNRGVNTIRKLWADLSEAEIIDAFEIAARRMPLPHWEREWARDGREAAEQREVQDALFRYFCGVCWRKIKGGERCGERP